MVLVQGTSHILHTVDNLSIVATHEDNKTVLKFPCFVDFGLISSICCHYDDLHWS